MPAQRQPHPSSRNAENRTVESRLRVIGGDLRGRTIPYNGDKDLRPMKDRVREAVFNLVGPRVVGKHVLDLFAGTGAMAFESLSRKAARATLFERKFPTAKLIETAALGLGLEDRATVSAGDTFIWAQRLALTPNIPWLIFCCPPYEFYVSRREDMFRLIEWVWTAAPPTSLFVIESDERFDPADLIPAANWDVRQYPPAVIGIAEKPASVGAANGAPANASN